LRFNGGDAEHLGVMIERLLVDGELRDRLVAEASEHVLSFDWDDIARRTRAIYSELRPRRSPREETRRSHCEEIRRSRREEGVKRA
jgi:glycogen(starch) synthase